MLTNKPLSEISDGGGDCAVWNAYLNQARVADEGTDPRWFETSWLYAECYAYRRMLTAFRSANCEQIKREDFFAAKKRKALRESLPTVVALVATLKNIIDEGIEEKLRTNLKTLLSICLWGNRWDLSISAGHSNSASGDPQSQLSCLEPFVLVDDCDRVWDALRAGGNGGVMDVVMDNAGFEMLSDLCLADFICQSRLTDKV